MARTSAPRRRGGPLEKEIQRPLVAILRLSGLTFFAIPNSTDLHMSKAQRMTYTARQKALGLETGAPDLMILTPPPCGGYNGLALEVKSKTGVLKPKQREWRDKVIACGWAWRAPRSVDEAIAELEAFGYVIKRTPLG